MTKKTRRILGASILTLLAVILAAVLFGWWLTTATPDWWQPADTSSPDTARLGESLENHVVSALHRLRPADDSTWTLDLPEESVNAWLATRFPKWAANRAPNSSIADSIRDLHVRISPDVIRIGARVGSEPTGRPFSVALRATSDADNKWRIEFVDAALGRLPLPVNTFLDVVLPIIMPDNVGPGGVIYSEVPGQYLPTLMMGQPAAITIDLGNGRRVRLLSLESSDGSLRVTLRTESNP